MALLNITTREGGAKRPVGVFILTVRIARTRSGVRQIYPHFCPCRRSDKHSDDLVLFRHCWGTVTLPLFSSDGLPTIFYVFSTADWTGWKARTGALSFRYFSCSDDGWYSIWLDISYSSFFFFFCWFFFACDLFACMLQPRGCVSGLICQILTRFYAGFLFCSPPVSAVNWHFFESKKYGLIIERLSTGDYEADGNNPDNHKFIRNLVRNMLERIFFSDNKEENFFSRRTPKLPHSMTTMYSNWSAELMHLTSKI